jgi:hypothetical protein
MSAPKLIATVVIVEADYVLCPACGARVDGWCKDPRGLETECDACDVTFAVAADAELQVIT